MAPLFAARCGRAASHQHHRADDVDVKRLQPVGARRLGAIVEIGAGDVDQEIEAAVALDGRRDQRVDVGVAGDVGPDEARLGSDAGRHALAVGLVDVGNDDVHAVARQHRRRSFRRSASRLRKRSRSFRPALSFEASIFIVALVMPPLARCWPQRTAAGPKKSLRRHTAALFACQENDAPGRLIGARLPRCAAQTKTRPMLSQS